MFNIFGFYKFKKINNLKKLKKKLENNLKFYVISGTIIISSEGVNGTISAKNNNLLKFNKLLKKILSIKKYNSENNSNSKFNQFHKPKVKIKKEVVPMGFKVRNYKYPKNNLNPREWNKIIKKNDTVLIDARKSFEYDVGTFKKSLNPNVENFRQFPKYLNQFKKSENIAMFCTGGIRCEKANIYLKKKGFKNVYVLKGGIINYLNNIDKKNSQWSGECFVFDNRVSIKHGLKQGSYSVCSGCRKPLSVKEKKSSKYLEGIHCPKCHDHLTDDQKSRFAMRQKQIILAKKTGKRHIFKKEY